MYLCVCVDNVYALCVCVWHRFSIFPKMPVNSINIYCVLCARPCFQCCRLYQDKSSKVPGLGELTIRITHIRLASFPLQGNFQASYVITQSGSSLRHAGTSAAGAGRRRGTGREKGIQNQQQGLLDL